MKELMSLKDAIEAIFVAAFSRLPTETDFSDGLEQFAEDFPILLNDAVPDHIRPPVINSIISILFLAGCDPNGELRANGDFGPKSQAAMKLLCEKLEVAKVKPELEQVSLQFPEPDKQARLAEEEKKVLGAHC